MIDREIANRKDGKPAHMMLKMNSLTDVQMIEKLYEASKARVKIDLIVRGICSLKPGVKGISETIRDISIVGRYLEHSRVFYFENGGSPELYLSSADLMSRNLFRRVELMFPIEDPAMIENIKKEVFVNALADTSRSRELQADGTYRRLTPKNGEEIFDSQQALMLARSKGATIKRPIPREVPPAE